MFLLFYSNVQRVLEQSVSFYRWICKWKGQGVTQPCKSICLSTRIEFCFSRDKHFSAARGQEEEKENPSKLHGRRAVFGVFWENSHCRHKTQTMFLTSAINQSWISAKGVSGPLQWSLAACSHQISVYSPENPSLCLERDKAFCFPVII